MSYHNQSEKHLQTHAFVHIEGKKIQPLSVTLEQAFGEHHRFEVRLEQDGLKESLFTDPAEQFSLIGRSLDIDLQQGNDYAGGYEFRGVITNVCHEGQEGLHGVVILEGASPTVLLERGKRLDMFSDMTLRFIVDDICEAVPNKKLPLYNHPEYMASIDFLMQYYESDWEFLRRLSAISGETLLYTGFDLVFGKYPDWPEYEVMYDRELTRLRFGTRLLPNHFYRYGYAPGSNTVIGSYDPKSVDKTDVYLRQALDRNDFLSKERPPRLPVDLPIEDQGSVDEMAEREKIRNASQTIYIEGNSKVCSPRIGRLLNIRMPDGKSLGTYRVVKVRHHADQNSRYSCEFEAIPGNLEYFPVPEVKMPVASCMEGVVYDTNDPEGMGRVKVDFPFNHDRQNFTWLRVMTPDGGGSVENYRDNKISENRGFVFIPEAGDRVMIGFEYGDPNRPYVMGSMFHGKNTSGGGEGNNIKSIKTKSGHTIEFDDSFEGKGITIKDSDGNCIYLDTKGKNIEITAPETMTLNAKNIIIDAQENVHVHAGENISSQADESATFLAGEDMQFSSNNISTQAATDSVHSAKKCEVTGEKVRVDSTAENLELASGKEVDVQSSKKVKLF